MPVTINPASHEPKRHPEPNAVASLDEFLRRSCPDAYVPDETYIVASSFAARDNLSASSSSFVRSAIEAWGRHSHLVIRPDDVWFTILVQMNFYMEKNAESLRHLFVSHSGKEKLEVWGGDWESVIVEFRSVLHAKIKTEWMSDWISPGFSTSTADDETTATVLMMGLMKSYFDYSGGVICGIPSITLLGTKQDWERLAAKTDRLKDFGSEPAHYAQRMAPILSRLALAFDNPEAEDTRDFFDQMVQAKIRHSRGCGEPPTQYIVSGWILGLFYWDATGRVEKKFASGTLRRQLGSAMELDGIGYGEAALEDIPAGYAKAEFTMLSEHGAQGDPYKGWVLAGSIGKHIFPGTPEEYSAALRRGWSRPKVPTRNTSSNKEASGDSEDDQTAKRNRRSLLGGLLCGCFRSSSEDADENARPMTEKKPVSKAVVSEKQQFPEQSDNHTTIQPLSGWFLFGPNKDVTPFYEGEEVYGPTVDALESCDGIEHYDVQW